MEITKRQVETAWKLSTIAADWHEAQYIERSRQRMVEATDYAERLQAEYDAQQQPTKRIVLAFDGKQTKIDPQFCDHNNLMTCYRDIDGVTSYCPDCGALLDENGDIVRMPLDEIPY